MSKIDAIVAAPVVSADTTSPEAVLAREAKKIQLQAHADSKYDDKEFFTNYGDGSCGCIVHGLLYSALFVGVVVFMTRRK